METSHPPIPFDPQGLVALDFLSADAHQAPLSVSIGNSNGLFHRSHAHPVAHPMPPGPPVRKAPARLPQRTTPASRAGRSRSEPQRSRRRLVQRPQTASTLLGWTDANAAGRLFVNALAHAGRGGETGTPTRTASTGQETGVHAGRRAAWGHNTECGILAAAGRLRGAQDAGVSAQHRSAACEGTTGGGPGKGFLAETGWGD
jgi:hypothetical protein